MHGDYDRVRALLLEPEQQRLATHEEALGHADRQLHALPELLATSIEQANRTGNASRLARALSESTAESLELAVRRRPNAVVQAMFPVIGPAVRRALGTAMRHLADDLDQALHDTLSLRALRWRFEAWRTGRPYSHVALRHRLTYRVEHLFVVDRENGLLLDHVSASDVGQVDVDAVAGMLTAIAQFVNDSVVAEHEGDLDAMAVGEYRVLVRTGPRARLAAFIRGVPPADLGQRLDELTEEIHARHGDALTDMGAEGRAGLVDPAALTELEAASSGEPAVPHRNRFALGLIIAIAVAALFWGWLQYRWSTRVDQVRSQLAAWPGLVLLDLDSPRRGRLNIAALQDPLAKDPRAEVAALLGDGRVAWNLRPYFSAEPPLLAARAAQVLNVPASVDRRLDRDGVLRLAGVVPFADWFHLSHAHIDVPGIQRVDTSALRYPHADRFDAAAAAVESVRVTFVDGVAPGADGQAQVELLKRRIDALQAQAHTAGIALRLSVVGLTDDPGTTALNRELRLRRAEWLAERIVGNLQPPAQISINLAALTALGYNDRARAAFVRVDYEPNP